MAGIYYTNFSFFGNRAVVARVEEWQNLLRPSQYLDNLAEQKAQICAVFYSGSKGEIDFGATSVDYKGDFTFESRLSPPIGLQDRVLQLLAKLDPNVVVGISYNKDDATEGYRYIVLDENGGINDDALGEIDGADLYCDEVEVDVDHDEDEVLEIEPNNEAMIDFRREQLEVLMDLAANFKGSKKYLDHEIKRLKRNISD